MQKIKQIIFDMDGTLLDTEPLYQRCWQQALLEVGIRLSLEDFLPMQGRGTAENDRYILQLMHSNNLEDAYKIRQRRNELFVKGVKAGEFSCLPEVLSTLSKLQGKVRLSLATSTTKEPFGLMLLEKSTLIKYLDDITYGNEVKHGKPAPDIFALALQKANNLPNEAVVIEDSVAGLQSALAANLTAYCVPQSQAYLSFPLNEKLQHLTHFSDILAIL